ncbi:MAG TPA: hypothetical protein QGG32_07430 [Rhodospirillales bacterium]|jgi:hypothetical protein|nr:hypothetical protein [Rhodospirillales bacterium]
MSKVDLHPIRNNPDLPDFFKRHLQKRIEEQNGQYGLAWRLIRRYREGRYCLAKKAGGKLCLNNAKVPGDGPRGRCGWHGGTGRTGPCLAKWVGAEPSPTSNEGRRPPAALPCRETVCEAAPLVALIPFGSFDLGGDLSLNHEY